MSCFDRCAMWAVLFCALTTAGPILDGVRDEVHSSPDTSSSSSDDDHDTEVDTTCYDYRCDDPLPAAGRPRAPGPLFAPYPYAGGRASFWAEERRQGRPLQLRVRGDASWVPRGLWRFGGDLQLTLPRVLGMLVAGHYLHETSDGDGLWLGRLNLFAPLLAAPRIRIRVGGGLQMLFERQPALPSGRVAGWNVTAGTDILVQHPFVVSIEGDVGQLGEATTYRGRGTLGILPGGRTEFFLGYQHTQIGAQPLGGPLAGFRLWI